MMKLNKVWSVILLCVFTVMVCAVFAQEGGEAAAEAEQKLSLYDLISQGGWAMIPLGLCSLLLVSMIIMNARQVSQKKLIPEEVVADIHASSKMQDFGAVWNKVNAVDCFFTRGLKAGLRHVNVDDVASSVPRMEEAIGEAVSREEAQISFWINFLSLIAGVAPMIGLLGTVSGMIGAFQQIASGGMGKPELLAGDIGEALITTATGLTIAIPAVFSYFLFRNMLGRVLARAEEEYSMVMDELAGTGIVEMEE